MVDASKGGADAQHASGETTGGSNKVGSGGAVYAHDTKKIHSLMSTMEKLKK